MGRLFGKGVTAIAGIRVVVEGREHLDNHDAPAVIISNHQNNFDVFVIGQMTAKRTVSVGKEVIKYFPLFGQIYWLSGNILINRSNKKQAFRTMNDAGQKMKDNKLKVWVMAEGTRSKGRGLLPFKKGPFYMSIQNSVPIFPICISSYEFHLDLKKWHACTVKLRVGTPIKPESIVTEGAEQSEKVMQLKDHCEKLMHEQMRILDTEVYGYFQNEKVNS